MTAFSRTVWRIERRFTLTLVVAALLTVMFGNSCMVAVNMSASLPGTVYFARRKFDVVELRTGQTVVFHVRAGLAEAFGYPPDMLWTKRIAGLPGDRVEVDAGRMVRVAERNIGKALFRSSHGTPLTPVRNGLVIPEGLVFVAGESVDSMDSRYAFFGLVPVSAVEGIVTLVL